MIIAGKIWMPKSGFHLIIQTAGWWNYSVIEISIRSADTGCIGFDDDIITLNFQLSFTHLNRPETGETCTVDNH